MPYRTCDHLKEDGVFCNSPALRGRHYCYFHLSLRGRRLRAAQARRRGQTPSLNPPFPEDMYAVQVSLHEVMQGLANHSLDPKNAGLLLYALQQASTNLLQTPEWKGSCQPVEPERPLLALNVPAFEEQYELPKGIDLDAEPEAALNEAEAEAGVAHNCLPSAIVGSDTPAQKATRKKKPVRRRVARVPLEKELWEYPDKDAPFRAYTSDGRELTREDAKRWYERTLRDMENFLTEVAETCVPCEDAA